MRYHKMLLINKYIESSGFINCSDQADPAVDVLIKLIQGEPIEISESIFQLPQLEIQIEKLVGKGTQSHVFSVNHLETDNTFALKVQAPACPYEYYISRQIQDSVDVSMVWMKNSENTRSYFFLRKRNLVKHIHNIIILDQVFYY